MWKTNRRDEKAPPHIENYSTQNATVHAVIRRPRWNDDGTPVRTQYLNPDYEKIVEENLWRLTGKPGIPSEKELDDEASFPAPMVKALRDDKKALLEAIMRSEGSDAAGLNSNLQGTSFAAPTAGGVMLAASILYPNASKEEIMDAFCSSCVPITHRQMPHDFWEKAPTETRDDVTYLADAKTGYLYSPMAGFGEFLLDKKATQEKPDSWLKMVARLEAMEKERLRITGNGKRKTTVEVGEGTFKRTVELNGQPTPVTLELTKGTAQITDDMKKRAQATQDRVMEAFRDVDRYNDSSIIIPDDSPIAKLITERKYQEALDLLKKDYAGEGKMLAYGDVYLKAAETAVENALKEREQAYSFTVKPDQDACCTLASLRLKFKTTQDEYVVLEAPDGTRIPMLLSSRTDNVAVTSTPGVMRKSAAGTWKVYSRSELDMDNTSLVISGTERNKDLGIIDVRETVLPAFELREVKDRTPPGKNIMPPIADPHAALRLLHNPPPEPEKKGKTKVSPSTRQEFQLNLEEFIEKSNLRKGGYIPEGKIEKTSRRNDAPFMEQLTGRLADALADARLVLGSGESMARLPTTAKPQKQQTTGMARPAAKLAI